MPWAAREAARMERAWMYRFGRKSTMESKVVDKVWIQEDEVVDMEWRMDK